MKKIIIVCLCAALLLVLPFTSLAVIPKPLVPENRLGVPTPDNGDPNGPTEGFLDDPTDWKYLVKGCFWFVLMAIDEGAVYVGILNITSQEKFDELLDNPNLISALVEIMENLTELEEFIMLLLTFSMGAEMCIAYGCFIEAFDIWDIDGDGC